MYDDYKVYGPYGKGRKMVALVSPGHRTTMAYARYLMSVHLGRELTDEEEVDHIDDDCTNDVITNLQILTPEQNKEKQDRKRLAESLITLVCPECQQPFTRARSQTHLRRPRRTDAPSCCSRSCSVAYHNKQRKRRGVEELGHLIGLISRRRRFKSGPRYHVSSIRYT